MSANLNYIRKLYAAQDALLERIAIELRDIGMAIQINPEEGKLLQLLIRMHKIKTIVEIGTLAGYSAIWMARALPPGGCVYAINKDPEHVRMAQRFFDQSDVKERIVMFEGNAHDVLPMLSGRGPFDMVFIDADKESYNDYLDWSEMNIRRGGLITADNTLLFDAAALDSPPKHIAPATWAGMRRFNERLADPNRYCAMMIPTDDGLTIALKEF